MKIEYMDLNRRLFVPAVRSIVLCYVVAATLFTAAIAWSGI